MSDGISADKSRVVIMEMMEKNDLSPNFLQGLLEIANANMEYRNSILDKKYGINQQLEENKKDSEIDMPDKNRLNELENNISSKDHESFLGISISINENFKNTIEHVNGERLFEDILKSPKGAPEQNMRDAAVIFFTKDEIKAMVDNGSSAEEAKKKIEESEKRKEIEKLSLQVLDREEAREEKEELEEQRREEFRERKREQEDEKEDFSLGEEFSVAKALQESARKGFEHAAESIANSIIENGGSAKIEEVKSEKTLSPPSTPTVATDKEQGHSRREL